jgi:hypothetical protein
MELLQIEIVSLYEQSTDGTKPRHDAPCFGTLLTSLTISDA